MGHLKVDAHSPACLAGLCTGSDSTYLWTGGSDCEDGCRKPESAGKRMKHSVSSTQPLIYVDGVTSGRRNSETRFAVSKGLRHEIR